MTPSKFIHRAIDRLKQLKRHPSLARFIKHNRRVFPVSSGATTRNPVVLFELNEITSAHIAYSYLANELAEREQAKLVAYAPPSFRGWPGRLYRWAKRSVKLGTVGAYSSFGTTGYLDVDPTEAHSTAAKKITGKLGPQIRNKSDVEDLTLGGVWIGNLIYDSYLRSFKKPTIDIQSPEFLKFFEKSIAQFVFWQDFFDNNDVRAVNLSHCVYNHAMPLRLAVSRNIPVFQSNVTHVYRLDSKNMYAYNDFHYFRERFAALSESVKREGLARAERQLQRRFAGEVGVDMAYSKKSAYGAIREERLLKDSPRKKILIATHCFFDSPHSYGNNLFPDFYEWLDFLGKITVATDYDWYIKTHPDYLPGTMEIILEFIKRYPKFSLLPSDASHKQIIAEGLDVALTVYGTIAFEYAALGVPVINASRNNPHIAYDFNLHPRDVGDYRRMLMDLDNLDLEIDRTQVFEYYFMRHIYNSENLFFDDYATTVEQLGGYREQFKLPVYDKWLDEFSPEKHKKIQDALKRFLAAEDFRMDYTHYGREFTLDASGQQS